MARRILNRKDLRAANDAAERRLTEDEEVTDEEAGDEDEDEDEEKGEADGDAEGDGDGDAEAEGDEDDEDAPVVKKKKAVKVKAVKAVKAKAKPRSRTAKVTRMKVVWGVFNNSNQCVASYPYPQKADADAHAAKLTADKRNTHFVQPVKEPMEEKKEKE